MRREQNRRQAEKKGNKREIRVAYRETTRGRSGRATGYPTVGSAEEVVGGGIDRGQDVGADSRGWGNGTAERIRKEASSRGEEWQRGNADRGDRQVAGSVKRSRIGGGLEQSKYGVVTNRG